MLCHNSWRDVFSQFCHQARLGGQLEVGCGLGADKRHSRPADILVQNWIIGKPAAFDFTVTSPLNPTTLTEAGITRGSGLQLWQLNFESMGLMILSVQSLDGFLYP